MDDTTQLVWFIVLTATLVIVLIVASVALANTHIPRTDIKANTLRVGELTYAHTNDNVAGSVLANDGKGNLTLRSNALLEYVGNPADTTPGQIPVMTGNGDKVTNTPIVADTDGNLLNVKSINGQLPMNGPATTVQGTLPVFADTSGTRTNATQIVVKQGNQLEGVATINGVSANPAVMSPVVYVAASGNDSTNTGDRPTRPVRTLGHAFAVLNDMQWQGQAQIFALPGPAVEVGSGVTELILHTQAASQDLTLCGADAVDAGGLYNLASAPVVSGAYIEFVLSVDLASDPTGWLVRLQPNLSDSVCAYNSDNTTRIVSADLTTPGSHKVYCWNNMANQSLPAISSVLIYTPASTISLAATKVIRSDTASIKIKNVRVEVDADTAPDVFDDADVDLELCDVVMNGTDVADNRLTWNRDHVLGGVRFVVGTAGVGGTLRFGHERCVLRNVVVDGMILVFDDGSEALADGILTVAHGTASPPTKADGHMIVDTSRLVINRGELCRGAVAGTVNAIEVTRASTLSTENDYLQTSNKAIHGSGVSTMSIDGLQVSSVPATVTVPLVVAEDGTRVLLSDVSSSPATNQVLVRLLSGSSVVTKAVPAAYRYDIVQPSSPANFPAGTGNATDIGVGGQNTMLVATA